MPLLEDCLWQTVFLITRDASQLGYRCWRHRRAREGVGEGGAATGDAVFAVELRVWLGDILQC